MKATFFERLVSYILDYIIVGIIFLFIFTGVEEVPSPTKKLMAELDTKLMENSITMEEYANEYPKLLYDYQKETILTTGISIALTIAYYAVFQYMNNGQTIGKRILRIRVVDKNTQQPVSILKGSIRTILIYNIFSGVVGIPLLYMLKPHAYFLVYFFLAAIELTLILISAMFVLYRQDKRGIHDILTDTIVVKE